MAPPRKRSPSRRKTPSLRARLAALRGWLAVRGRRMILPLAFIAVAFIIWFLLSLPDITHLDARKTPGVIIKAEDGRIIGSYGQAYGEFVPYRQLPATLVQALLATEDRNFFHHHGVDPLGLLRAMLANVRAGHTVQGGSTISQQLAKNLFLTPERSLLRKLREALLAFKLEQHYTKEQILSLYLNRVYLGAGNFGVEAAAHRYFNKSARDLSLSESAVLVGLLKAPSRFAPTSNPDAAKQRGEQVIANMVDAGYLSAPQAAQAKKELAQVITRTARNSAESMMYFTDWVIDQLPDFVGDVQEDLVVTATLRPELQRAGEQAIHSVMDKSADKMDASQAALLAMTPDGAIRVMIGGRNYAESPYNRAAQARRQPGSSFKLFVYLTALEGGMTPSSTVVDQPVSVGKWQPKNYTGGYRGEMALSEAVAQSINTVAVQLSERFGRSNVISMAHRLGLTSEMEPLPSIALGATEVSLLELTGAYAHLAADGMQVVPYGIVTIDTASGKRLYQHEPTTPLRVLSESVVAMMNSLLSGVISHGTGRAAQIGRPAAGKTGTTSDYRDAWFIGYTPDLAAGVWVGNDDNTPMRKVTGGMLPAPIWRNFMKTALANVPPHELPTSSGFWSAILPWLSSPADAPAESYQPAPPAPIAPPESARPHPAPPDAGFRLGPQFWNKLLKIEPVYPEQPRH
ncbi:MAG: penicillin-binding protein 1A [Alphaproteobacteria bacterium]|nr:penicillin-binding protein 1A [Alphaproteobacteria bacterium]